MYSKFAPVLGSLAIASLAAAVPVEKRDIWFGSSQDGRKPHLENYQGGQPSASYSGPANGYYTASATSGSGSWSTSAPPASTASGSNDGSSNPFSFPLSNGFPNIQNPSSQLTAIEAQAHGLLPNGPPPPTAPAADDLTSLRLIAFNELWEVAFFTELLFNVTHNVQGYQFQDESQKQTVIDAITAVQAQEELHALNANGALGHFNAGPIQPCKYVAPVSDFKSAINLAKTFTDVVLGTLGDVQTHFGDNGDNGLIRGVAAVIGQEGEQNGFYRNLLGLIPSGAPFLTASTREFAFSALNQDFVVPGSCPNSNTIDLPIFGVLNVLTQNIQPQDQTLQFSFEATGSYSQYASNYQGLSLVYINQQNVPVVEPITQATVSGSTVTFSANLPFTENDMFGLTIAAVVEGSGPFATVADVAAATKFGPGLIEIQ
ncbi:uncharacterized protein Z520_05744 [Fonsecaea multimorphosa CBS 102226]|uniref:Late sexual development protein n=1 Tax=Fonsecaea multimorphosa CBS 102226 TaxID=1442371 RepID=A0A0D2KP50_9EURO|nr:uncharacterized protein Z520_05744 [Fonsecaea multimorphosa CBS 102226]KIX98443.1 hypothetical protein Z520_05744 [Fonsecaea multimorphosa CBS 102226]OAL24638.1 hypothetical protein AYO22_05427 [Fonsecaea multimorphosa]